MAVRTLLGVAALGCFCSLGAALVRGVAPEGQSKFAPGTPITCAGADGKPLTLPFEALNDDFCDCPDGTDEPGTGACAGQDSTLFHCNNDGATPQMIYTSRVDDGICDCCDGSDEAGFRARRAGAATACPNRCAEEGEVDKLQRVERMATLKQGLEKRQQIINNAVANRQQWTGDVARMEAELPTLEAARDEAKKAADAAAAVDLGPEALKAENEDLKKTILRQQAELQELQKELEKLKGGAEPKAEKKVVSEYAKWMDGAGSTPGAIEGEEALPDDDDGQGDLTDEEAMGLSEPLSTKPVVTSGGGAKKADDDALSAAEAKVKSNQEETKKLKKQLEHLDDDHLGYSSLDGRCISKHDGQYTYKLCFHDDAKQDHVSLGRWGGWTGPQSAQFTDGQMCPGGPARMLRVVFECGSEEIVLGISEPSRCIYETHVTSPGACLPEDIGKLEKPPLKHPREEL